jgi:hypothetical protein
MSKLLLKEFQELDYNNPSNDSVLNEEERKLKEEGYFILSGIIQSANRLNGNGRVYSRKILEREMDNYQKVIRERRSTGELDHADSFEVNLKNASHLILRAFWHNDDVYGIIKVLKNTPSGKILEGLLKDGVQLGISSRALGSLKETPQGAMVQDDLQLICFDIVNEPSTPNAYLIPESRTRNIFTKADRLNRLLNDITGD